ncbi:uncharacterized protein LOC124274574 [Haliotis rubra]|uniref:uncharacterized protein LOC124274574 n=1 Tax=Haliotis rubra TaxID=36100 RepID=UPI001EE53452|nr:uncharacterized protein LOC124274574 [Haliotis rubra]
MFELHQLFTGNKLLTMFVRVVFLLYLPAICFSFAIFPNDGHEAQRRQNPEENMVNLTYSQDEEPCWMVYYPCWNRLLENVALKGPEDIVVDGKLAVQCESNLLEESRNCVNAISQCNDDDVFYKIMQIFQRIWDFLCQHSQAFVAGKGCWSSSELPSATNGCNAPSGDVCYSTCIREAMANMTDCSTEESILLGRLAGVMMGQTEGSC